MISALDFWSEQWWLSLQYSKKVQRFCPNGFWLVDFAKCVALLWCHQNGMLKMQNRPISSHWAKTLHLTTPSPCYHVVSLDRKIYSMLPLFTQVYTVHKCYWSGVIMLGITLQWTSIPSRGVGGGVAILLHVFTSGYRNQRVKCRPSRETHGKLVIQCILLGFHVTHVHVLHTAGSIGSILWRDKLKDRKNGVCWFKQVNCNHLTQEWR